MAADRGEVWGIMLSCGVVQIPSRAKSVLPHPRNPAAPWRAPFARRGEEWRSRIAATGLRDVRKCLPECTVAPAAARHPGAAAPAPAAWQPPAAMPRVAVVPRQVLAARRLAQMLRRVTAAAVPWASSPGRLLAVVARPLRRSRRCSPEVACGGAPGSHPAPAWSTPARRPPSAARATATAANQSRGNRRAVHPAAIRPAPARCRASLVPAAPRRPFAAAERPVREHPD